MDEARDLSDREDISLADAIDVLIQEGYDFDDPILVEWSQQWPRD